MNKFKDKIINKLIKDKWLFWLIFTVICCDALVLVLDVIHYILLLILRFLA